MAEVSKACQTLPALGFLFLFGFNALAETLTIATVNNGDMIRMQRLADDFTRRNPSIDLEWVILEENILRQRVTTDVATGGGQYDVLTIGTYEVPIWAKRDWLIALNDLPESYDVDDILLPIRNGLSIDGELYAAPFYGESSMVMYRKDLFAEAGLEMPEEPSWEFIGRAARAIADKKNQLYGICLRGKPGWGENMALLTAMSNSFGARWFDLEWNPQFDSSAWSETLSFYVDLMLEVGPPSAVSNGFNENLVLFQTGKCGIWIDATVAASFVLNTEDSAVADRVGFAMAPDNGLGRSSGWLWAWSLGIPSSSEKIDAAKRFVAWATSKEYIDLVVEKDGWESAPPGTRYSLYEQPEYAKLPFASFTFRSIQQADPDNPSVEPVPYMGVQFVAIPQFQGMATTIGQQLSAALAGNISVEEALENAQFLAVRQMRRAGYIE